jgi:hypothetical protein
MERKPGFVGPLLLNLNFVYLDGANLIGARVKGANHAFAGTSKFTICPDSYRYRFNPQKK